MKILLTGLRGVGKSSVRKAVERETGFRSWSVGDMMEEYCLEHWPGISREEMQRQLTIEQQLIICHELATRLSKEHRLIVEAQGVMAEWYGTIIPVQPVFRRAGFAGIVVLTAAPEIIRKRRNEDVDKRRAMRYLDESLATIAEQQRLNEVYFCALGAHLGVHVVITKNEESLSEATRSFRQLIKLFEADLEFREGISH